MEREKEPPRRGEARGTHGEREWRKRRRKKGEGEEKKKKEGKLAESTRVSRE